MIANHAPAREASDTALSVARVRAEFGISREKMARLLDVSARSVQRWEEHDQLPGNRWVLRVLQEMDQIAELGHQALTPDAFRTLLTRPQPGFGNRSGLAAIEPRQASLVLGELAGLYEGSSGT